jgi:hypothetical protein
MKASTVTRTAITAAALFGGALANAGVLWDTGAPHPVNFNGTDTNLGFSSGNLGAGSEQRWAAMPFKIGAGGAVVNQIDVDWFVVAGSEADTVNYIIWKRNGLNAPVDGDQFASGILGAFGAGIDDPRTAATDDWLHQYGGLNINLPEGDYYFTMYGDGGAPANNCAWLTGGDLQDESLEQDFMWRSATFPAPGFAQYNPGNVLPGAEMADGQDRWNTCFTIYGDPVPAPGAGAVLGLAGLAGMRRRR